MRALTEREKLIYGFALIDTGQAKQGVKIVRAYVEANPQEQVAKLELARGLYLSGRLGEAKEIFDQVKLSTTALPANVATNIARYEQLISAREADLGFKFRPYVEFGLGHDDNVNSGLGQPNVTLPFFGPVQIASTGLAQKSAYQRAQAGVGISRAIDWDWSFIANLAVDARQYDQARAFDSVSTAMFTGLSYNKNADSFRASINYNNQRIANAFLRYIPSISLDYTRQFSSASINAGLQIGEQRYQGAQAVREVNYSTALMGVRYRLPFANSVNPVLTAQYSRTNEQNRSTRPDLAKNSVSLRLGVEMAPADKLILYTAATHTRSTYSDQDQFFGLTRQDKYDGYELGLQYALSPKWLLSANFNASTVQSNIELYTNRRNAFDLALRYSF